MSWPGIRRIRRQDSTSPGAGARRISAEVTDGRGTRKDLVGTLRALVLDRNAARRVQALVLGEPGAGKLTGMKLLARDLARGSGWRPWLADARISPSSAAIVMENFTISSARRSNAPRGRPQR